MILSAKPFFSYQRRLRSHSLPAELWAAYTEVWPPDPGYERRRPALQLHKFLNNIRHFGPDRYVPRIEAVLDGYGW